MTPRNRIPYAIGSYEELITGEYFFVDKTQFIRELEAYKVPVFLRPRRFGKSLWCSLLECYYDLSRKERFEELFGQFDIGREPTPERNSYLVLRFDFSVAEVKADLEFLDERFRSHCRNALDVFLARYRDLFQGFELTTAPAADMLGTVLAHCRANDLPPVYLILDEYDNFANQLIVAQRDDLFQELTTGDSFFRTFFKTIKAGMQEGSIGRFFATGVLPVTMDELTSGFNIAQIITLAPQFHSMLGFTEAEMDDYLARVFGAYGFETSRLPEIRDLMRQYYNGYVFDPASEERLYNSTIVNFFLTDFVLQGGKIPREFIDHNLRTDLSWLRRLTVREERTRELLDTLMFDRELPYDMEMVESKFNTRKFFERDFYPVSLFYLGMLTMRDDFAMTFPNQTVQTILTDHFNELEGYEVSKGYTDYFRRFLKDLDLGALFAGYWETYVGQLPAQAFDKMNEGFFCTTFYELCTRYLSRYFVFGIEVNHPSGRSDWELLGKHHTEYRNVKFVVEFKHFTNAEGARRNVLELEAPYEDDAEQVAGYAADIHARFPAYNLRTFVLYTVGNTGFRCFETTAAGRNEG